MVYFGVTDFGVNVQSETVVPVSSQLCPSVITRTAVVPDELFFRKSMMHSDRLVFPRPRVIFGGKLLQKS